MNNITTLGIDLAKNIFQLYGVNEKGKTVYQKRIRRNKLAQELANMPACRIGMEACGGSHYWARTFKAMGHDVKMMSPQYVKPYIQGNKNDANDAKGICEAVTRPSMRFVPIKSVGQQDIQMIHRIRSRLMSERVALTNQMRGLLQEYGIVFSKGRASLKKNLLDIIASEDNKLTPLSRSLFNDLYEEYLQVEDKLKKYDQQIDKICVSDERCLRLMSMPGIGPKIATALVASIGSAEVFENGRQLSAWLGLVPKQSSSGEKTRLLGISKRGDRYLRSLLVHGARSVVKVAEKKKDRTSTWIKKLIVRCGYNKAVVAVANKNARIVWALLSNKTDYQVNYYEAIYGDGASDGVKKAITIN